jgi:hypothetical protein
MPDIELPSTRKRLRVYVGGWIEVFGAAMTVTAVYLLTSLPWALVAGGVFLLIAAELVYDGTILRLPLPRRPHPIQRIRRRK